MMKGGAALASIQLGKTPMETLKNIPVNIREIRPHFLLSVPSLAKNFRKNIEKGIREKGPKVEALFRKALNMAYDYNGDGWDTGQGLEEAEEALHRPLRPARLQQGPGEASAAGSSSSSAAAPCSTSSSSASSMPSGIPMFQGYGLTEAAPVISANSPQAPQARLLGPGGGRDRAHASATTTGASCPPEQTGEIVIRGENVMAGYWKNDKATREALRDGWLYTGDLGYLDADGFLYVLGRMKSLLIASDGEKYSPEIIEEAIVENSPYIDQLMLYNDQSPFTVALLVPNKEALLRLAQGPGPRPKTPEGQDAALRLLEAADRRLPGGRRARRRVPARWLPSAVAVLGEGFTEQNRFLNSTLKMVRGRITDFYRNRIDHLFTPEARDIPNPRTGRSSAGSNDRRRGAVDKVRINNFADGNPVPRRSA